MNPDLPERSDGENNDWQMCTRKKNKASKHHLKAVSKIMEIIEKYIFQQPNVRREDLYVSIQVNDIPTVALVDSGSGVSCKTTCVEHNHGGTSTCVKQVNLSGAPDTVMRYSFAVIAGLAEDIDTRDRKVYDGLHTVKTVGTIHSC